MKRISIYIIALVTLGTAALTSCKKEFNGDAPTFTASLEYNEKTQFNGSNLYWSENDQVAIYGSEGRSVYNVILTGSTPSTNAKLQMAPEQTTPGNPSYTAIYPAAIAPATNTEIITLPATQASVNGELTGYPMYVSATNSTYLHFKNLCSVLKITMQKDNTQISKIQIITDQYINGDFEISYSNNTPALAYHNDNDQDNHRKVTTLTFSNGPVNISSSHDFYIYLPAGTYSYFQIKVYDPNGNIFTRTTTSGLTFERSEYNYLTIPTSAINFKPGDLLGEFSVSATKKVSFSKGNLLQSGSTYKFADYQYNKTESGYTYLFNWNDGDYAQTMNERGANPISNGGNTANMWRTLTQSEWHYLLSFDGRGVNYGDWRWALVKVNNIGGMIIFPDGFDWPLDESKIPEKLSKSATISWNSKNYTLDEWGTLEAAGCVFLPATGYKEHSNSSVTLTSDGYYWSCTPQNSSSNDKAKYTYFTSTSATFPTSQNGWYLDHELAIRLVKDVQ